MAIDHGMKFVKANGEFWSLEGIAAIDSTSSYRLRVAPESQHLLEPQVGDFLVATQSTIVVGSDTYPNIDDAKRLSKLYGWPSRLRSTFVVETLGTR